MTNLSHIASRVFNTPLMIDSKKLAAILAVLAPRLGAEPPAVEAALLAEQRNRKPYAVTDAGVAVIEVAGSLVNRASGMDAQSGLTSYEQLGNEILDAATDPQVKGVLLRFDSYGGEANGAWDVAGLIEEAARIKPVWASVDDWALSAGYLLASATDRIWVTRTGGVGSVGIIAMHLDQSGWDAENGLKYTTIFAGDRKNDFNPHEPLSEGARDVLVAEVDRLYGMFVDAVARRRSMGATAIRNTEAGILYGEDSVARGFADRIGTFRDALTAMTASLSQTKFTKGGTTVSEATQAATSPPVPDLAAIEAQAREQGYAEAAEIVVLCNIAGRPALAGDFIARHLAVADVRKELLTLRAEADQEDIRSHVLPEAGTAAKQNLDENPVVKACAALAPGAKGAK
ncbi:MAG: S49 family peptidase [Acidobacteria bacterium]|nr:S49 family peptidase [Acidobacteriota bacterium]